MKRAEPSLTNLNAALAAAGVAVLLALAYGAHVFSEKTESLAKDVARLAVAEVRISGVYTQVLEAESSQRGYLLVNDPNYLDPFRAARARGEENLAIAVQKLGQLNIDAQGLDALREIVSKKYDELEKTVALAQAGQRDAAIDIVRANHGRELMSRIRERTNAELDRLATMRKQWIVELQDSADKMSVADVLGSVAVFLLAALAVAQQFRHSRALASAQQNLAAANDALEHRVAARTRDLKRANEEIQRYAYIVSHDLRAPLVNIIGFARELETAFATVKPLVETACDEPGAEKALAEKALAAVRDDIPEALKFIRSSTSRMDALIAGILKLSRLGGLALQPQAIDLDQLARDCIATVAHRLNGAGAQVEIEGRLPSLVGDRDALSQVFANLLDNAAKYLSDARVGRIVLRGRQTAAQTIVEVEDNGRGVDLKDQSRIFELFRRAGAQDRPGDGIGLAHVRTLARRMGGDIAVRSDGRSGSIFTVTLPNDLRTFLNHEPREDRNV
ncbi:signal transduction histidine kinase [Rhodoblastus acidophilus]|uniref:sensor histidine kinase n=1 Tax=Rhodoblastus acidophilus TaxID=1074 RepID=UPI002224115C|nr:ATP-binding protein [Rhodoblastus acidophilus]MCW2285318.1 signal transduction histidine kinase [Rhodoblastus acidophilus]MCW2334274.1 signal transduction histidine kinase [Rhodoblastus acidophilus]